MSEEFLNPAQQPKRPKLLFRFTGLLSGVLDSVSLLFFCLTFSSLTHLLGSLWSSFLAEE